MNKEEKVAPTIRFDPAYSGGLLHMDPASWPLPTVFDVDGLEERPQEVPIVRDHDQNKKVGQTYEVDYSDGKIVAVGKVLNYGIDDDAAKVVELCRRGARLQASVGTCLIRREDVETVDAGQTAQANGRTFDGPCEIVRRWRLKEISVVTLGADDEGTNVTVGEAGRGVGDSFVAPRQKGRFMAKQYDWKRFFRTVGLKNEQATRAANRVARAADPSPDDVVAALKEELEQKKDGAASARSGKAAEGDDEEKERALCAFAEELGVDLKTLDEDAPERKVVEAAFARFGKAEEGNDDEEELRAFAEELGLDPEQLDENAKEALQAAFARFGKAEEGNDDDPEKKDPNEEGAQASRPVYGTGVAAWARTKYPVALLGAGTTARVGRARPTAARVAEASLFVANGTDGATLERLGYTQDEIGEANRPENRTLSLRGLIYRTGEAKAGYCDEAKIAEVLQKARWQAQRAEYDPGYRVGRAAGQLSTVDVPNVLANVVNKSMLNGATTVEDPTDSIARVVQARDFRPQYFVNLLASGEMGDVKSNGEVENLKLSDANYENSAKMRGFEVRIGYETIANDDMNAIQEIPKMMGRKAGLRKQKIFFDALTTASAASSPNNLPGVTNNPTLSLTGLDKGCAAFRALKDGDGDPIGARPKFLIVPPALEATALNLVLANDIVAGSTGDATQLAVVPNVRRYASRFEVITSEYLGADSPFSSNWGDKKWMLLADPVDVPLMIMSYYQNQKTPTIKTVYGDTEIEGLRFVLWWGVGVSVAEKKSCVVSSPS